MKKRTKINLVVLCVVFIFLLISWFGGGVGWFIRKAILPRFAPRKLGSSFMIYSFEAEERFEHESRGITLMLNPKRVKEIVRGAFPIGGRYMPPGLLDHGFHAQCMWMPHGEKDSSMGVVPVWIIIDRNAGYEPILKGRMPVNEVNTYLKKDMEEALASKEKWIFGSYIVLYEITFENMRIISGTGATSEENHRKLSLTADGRVRITFDDKPISARTTAKVKELKAEVDMTFVPRGDEYALVYEARVTDLRMNVNNMLKWGDERVAESLRKSLEKSLNRSKNKKKAMKLRIPEWAARDMIVDIQLSAAESDK